jgi:hypothetical protein
MQQNLCCAISAFLGPVTKSSAELVPELSGPFKNNWAFSKPDTCCLLDLDESFPISLRFADQLKTIIKTCN